MTIPPVSSAPCPFIHPCSVSLKINASSVMLYRNSYQKGMDGQRGHSEQEYLCSFSIHETEIPVQFHEYLRQATTQNPERYEQLVETILNRVLLPARQRQQEKQLREQSERIKRCVHFASQQLKEAADCAVHNQLNDMQIQQELRQVYREAKRLMVAPPQPTTAPVSLQPLPDAAEQSEQKLQQLLDVTNQALLEIQAMVPMAGQQFPKGYKFSEDTVMKVRRMWFHTTDAVDALNQRKQLRRPTGWPEMRDEVMPPKGESTPFLEDPLGDIPE